MALVLLNKLAKKFQGFTGFIVSKMGKLKRDISNFRFGKSSIDIL